MHSSTANAVRSHRALWTDLGLVALLVGLDVIARLAPHAPNFTPVAASALFAATMLRRRALAALVPIGGLFLSDLFVGFYDWGVMAAVYGTLALPALLAGLSNRLRRMPMAVPVLLSSSLTFFAVTNFAVWALSPMYAATLSGLIKCYIAALPFLKTMMLGDLFWGAALFGGYWLVQAICQTRPRMRLAVVRRS